jgi:hypothetical protein
MSIALIGVARKYAVEPRATQTDWEKNLEVCDADNCGQEKQVGCVVSKRKQ